MPSRKDRFRFLITPCAALAALLFSLGCGLEGPDPGTTVPEPPETWENSAPEVLVASPSELSVGDDLTLVGTNFISEQYGRPLLHLRGTFFSESGTQYPVDQTYDAKRSNSTKIRWKLWPNVVFTPTGRELGYFLGTVQAINEGKDHSRTVSEPLQLKITIKPSIIVNIATPVGAGCSGVIDETLPEVPYQFAVEAIGLRAGTAEAPLTFKWAFMAKDWKISFRDLSFDPETMLGNNDDVILEDKVEDGSTSAVMDGDNAGFLVKAQETIMGSGHLSDLKTKALPAGSARPATVAITATDASGKMAILSVPITVHPVIQLLYDGNAEAAQRHEPQLVSDCIAGGNIGREVSYSESSSESRSRAVAVNWHAEATATVAPFGLFMPHSNWAIFGATLNFTVGFGTNTSSEISTHTSESLQLSGHIHPGEYGAFYRQTTKIRRVADMIGHTICGQALDIGKAVLTDWVFTPDLAISHHCVPPTSLPAAATYYE